MNELQILYSLQTIHNSVLDPIMVFVTKLVDKGIIWIALGIILLFFKKTRKCGIMVLVSMGIGLLIGNGIIKNLVQRPRPFWIDASIPLLIPKLSDYSFPSGHTLACFEAATIILLHNEKWGIVAILFGLLVGFSRMYLFVHFPTDVIGGALLGAIISITVFYSYEIFKKYRKPKAAKTQTTK